MTGVGHNSDANKARISELRRMIQSSKGKIERRETAILFANRDIRIERTRIGIAESEIESLGGTIRR